MNISQEKIASLANAIEDLEAQKKEITKEINQFYDDFIDENGLEKKIKKQLKGSIEDYMRFRKDRAKYQEEEYIFNQLLDLLVGEKQ